jgi:hypothetical protein
MSLRNKFLFGMSAQLIGATTLGVVIYNTFPSENLVQEPQVAYVMPQPRVYQEEFAPRIISASKEIPERVETPAFDLEAMITSDIDYLFNSPNEHVTSVFAMRLAVAEYTLVTGSPPLKDHIDVRSFSEPDWKALVEELDLPPRFAESVYGVFVGNLAASRITKPKSEQLYTQLHELWHGYHWKYGNQRTFNYYSPEVILFKEAVAEAFFAYSARHLASLDERLTFSPQPTEFFFYEGTAQHAIDEGWIMPPRDVARQYAWQLLWTDAEYASLKEETIQRGTLSVDSSLEFAKLLAQEDRDVIRALEESRVEVLALYRDEWLGIIQQRAIPDSAFFNGFSGTVLFGQP